MRLSVVRAVAPYLNGISANPPPRGRELSSLLVGLVRNRRKNHRVVNRHVRGGSHRGGIVDRAGCPRNPRRRRHSRLRGIFCGTGRGSGPDHGWDRYDSGGAHYSTITLIRIPPIYLNIETHFFS